MPVKAAVVTLGLGAVFIAAFAATQIAQRSTPPVAWKEMDGQAAAVDVLPQPAVVDLRAQLEEIRKQLPGAPALALAQLKVPEEGEFCAQAFPLDRPMVREALAYELILTTGRPLMPMLWMRRAPGILPMIESKLAEAGLPDDLKYVAVIESDLRLTPRSPAGAVGLWQFMRATARQYGLRVDRYLDERKDPIRSTDAALRHLADLHEEFGDWFLALAAYNAGKKKIQNAVKDAPGKDYFDLYLPYETRRYLPRLMAAKLVTEDPESYGLVRMNAFHLPRYRIVEVQVRRSRADLKQLSEEHGLDYAALRLVNLQVRTSRLPRGNYRLRVPVD